LSAAVAYEKPGGPAMTRTRVGIDSDLLAQVMDFLGTTSKSEAVNQALAIVVRAAAFEREVELAKSGGYDDLLDAEADEA
jgi:Arc/MetJ family transcription regulator